MNITVFIGGMMVRLAYLIDSITCDTAGTQKQLLEIIRRLDRDQFYPYLICLWESDWMIKNELPCHCIVLGYQGFLKRSFPAVIKRLAHIVKEQRLNIIQTFFEDSIFVGLLAKVVAKTPLILLSSRRDMGLGKENQPWYHSLFTLALPWVNHYFTGIIANSEQVKLYVAKREKTALSKIKVIRNGVDIPEKQINLPALLKDKKGIIWIGMVASLTSVKRHDVLIKAVAALHLNGFGGKFQIILLGEGSEYDYLTYLVAEYSLQNDIHFVGAVNDISPYLYSIDIGVLCSDREGLSNAILEYMACGLPVVATSVGGNVELVDEENGICFAPGDHHALAVALQRLIEDEQLRKKLGSNSLLKIQQSFSWEKSMAELETYYTTLVSTKI